MDILDEDDLHLVGHPYVEVEAARRGTVTVFVIFNPSIFFRADSNSAAFRHNSRCANSWLYHRRTTSVVTRSAPHTGPTVRAGERSRA